MRKLFICCISLLIFGCSGPKVIDNPPSPIEDDGEQEIKKTPQEIVDEFNGHSYDISLLYQEGQYYVAPNVVISGEEIKSLLNGSRWRESTDGVINLDGLFLDSSFASDASVTYSFFDDRVSIYIKVIVPGIEDTEEEKSVTFEDNRIKIGRDVFLVCSIEESTIYYIVNTNYENRWLYKSLRLVQ